MAIADLKINHLGPQGDGVSRGPKGTIFVDRGAPGDRVKAHLRRDSKGITRAEIVRIITPSPFRTEPPCPHYEKCGNCTVQHLKSDFYRQWKVNLVEEALTKNRLTARHRYPPVFIESPSRRRATFSAQWEKGKFTIGYYKRRTKTISDITSCLVADPALLKVRDALKPFLKKILPSDDTIDCFIQKVDEKFDVVLVGRLNSKISEAIKLVDTKKAGIARIGFRHPEGEKITTIFNGSALMAHFGDLTVALPPAAFLQPTPEGETALVNAVIRELPDGGHFADLFSGCGTFSGPMLAKGSVDAYEVSGLAVEALYQAAKKHKLSVTARDLFRDPLPRAQCNDYDAIIFDPPRAGAPEQTKEIAASRVPIVIAVSCNPASFAKDAATLCKGGYRFQSIQLVDQFQWSHHTELVGVFTKSQSRRR